MAVASPSLITGIDIVAYLVQDPDRAVAFYRDALGLPVLREYGGNGAEFELADGTTFGVWKMDDGTFEPSQGVMFSVPDLKAAIPIYLERGVKLAGNGHIEESPVGFMAFGEDTEGNKFILHQRK